MKKRILSILIVLVLLVTYITPIHVSAAALTQEKAVINLLRWAKFTQTDANTVGGWVELAYYVDLVLDTDAFDADANCATAYYNTMRKRANVLYRQNSVSKIPVYPFVKVDAQPNDTSVKLGGTFTLTTAASISNGTEVSYQWYSCADTNQAAASMIEGATAKTLTVSPEAVGELYYFCRFSAKTEANVTDLDSNVVCVSVFPPDPCIIINAQPQDLFPDRGSEATLTVGAHTNTGAEVSYQWYSCADKTKADAAIIEGATGATYTVPTEMYGDYYYFCRVSAENIDSVDSDVVCVDVPVMMYKDGLAQPIFTYTDASVETYTNEGSDIVRFCVYVESDYDTDYDGKLDLIKAVVQIPRAAMEGEYEAAVIYEARPYCAGTTNNYSGSGSYEISMLYNTADPRTTAGSATTAEVAAAASASDFYYYEDLDWYDYFLVRGYAVVVSAGPGTRGSEGFETCGSDLEIDAFACVIEWLTGDRVAYTDKTNNIAIEADWCNEQIGMTGRSYAGTTQFGLATTGVAGLKTIVPVAGIASWYEYSCSQGMYQRPEGYTDYLAGYCGSRYLDSADWGTISSAFESYLAQLNADEEALKGSYGDHWRVRDYTTNAAKIKCPALIVHGLNDNNVRTKHMAMMYNAYKTAGVDVKLLLTQDGHVTPAYGANKTEQFIAGEPYQDVLNRWFSHYLYNIDNGADDMAAVTAQSNIDGSWKTYDSWETTSSMTMGFSPNVTIQNYSSGISSSNYVSKYTAGNTSYSTVEIMDITEDVTITGTIKVTVTATPQTIGNNQMLTAFLVDMSDTAFNAYNVATGYVDAYHRATGEIFDVGGGAESYTVVELVPSSVTSKIIASGWIDLANPNAGFDSASAVEDGDTTLTEHTYDIYLQPNLYTVEAGHQLALVVCTRDPSIRNYWNCAAEYSVLISDVEATIPVY
jgi:X-Pro dipeptidyl-peptidase